MDFVVPADQRVKIKEFEKREKYLDLIRELKKLWNMRMTVVPIVISAHGTVPKLLERELEHLESGGQIESIQTTAFTVVRIG